jgi:hypothetical protein
MRRFSIVLFLGTSLLSWNTWAYTECSRPIKDVWTTLDSGTGVWVTFSDGGSAIFKNESDLTSGQMSRFVSFALTAQTANKKLVVRYPEDGLVCPPTGANRNDFQGVWIKK